MNDTNKLYIIGVKCSLYQLTECVGLVNNPFGEKEVAYLGFWDKVVIFEYDRDTKVYWVKTNLVGEPQYYNCGSEQELFKYMDDNNIQFVIDPNPLGNIFESYTAAYLELVRWAADVCYTRDYYNALLEG